MGRTAKSVVRLARTYGLAALFAAAGAVVFGMGARIGGSLNDQNPPKFELELAKALLALGSGLVLGGAVKILLDRFQDGAKKREEDHKRLERLLADLRVVHDHAENVRLLVAAHKSGETYGQQMRELIGCQVLLLKIKRTLDVTRKGGSAAHGAADSLWYMLGYLRALQNEYRERYKDVSDCQRYDDELTKRRLHRAAELAVGLTQDTSAVSRRDTSAFESAPKSSELAWNLLNERHLFPVLDDLTHCGDQYQKYFLTPLHALAAVLLKTTPGETEVSFDAEVETLAKEIGSVCEKQLPAADP